MKDPTHIIVIGASAGGLKALSELVRRLDEKMDAASFIVMHLSRTSISEFLINRLQPLTNLQCIRPTAEMEIVKGCIYIAPPNQHLIVRKGKIVIGKGPQEGRWRPSIDVLFRSAAAAYGSRVTGIILTGLLDDGKAGMEDIKKAGGTTIIQDPNEAEYPDMPLAVINSMEVDHCIPLSEMGSVLHDIIATKPSEFPIPKELIIEAEIAEKVLISFDNLEQIGSRGLFACPDCGGGLFEIKGSNGDRFRCHIGHAYTEKDFAMRQSEALESTLWIALRIMEERKNLFERMENNNNQKGFNLTALDYRQKAVDVQFYIDKLREILYATQTIIEGSS